MFSFKVRSSVLSESDSIALWGEKTIVLLSACLRNRSQRLLVGFGLALGQLDPAGEVHVDRLFQQVIEGLQQVRRGGNEIGVRLGVRKGFDIRKDRSRTFEGVGEDDEVLLSP